MSAILGIIIIATVAAVCFFKLREMNSGNSEEDEE